MITDNIEYFSLETIYLIKTEFDRDGLLVVLTFNIMSIQDDCHFIKIDISLDGKIILKFKLAYINEI